MEQTGHGAEEQAGAAEAAEAPQGQVTGKIRVTVRRLDRLEATSLSSIPSRGSVFSMVIS
jgi:hypothetical protein